MERFRNSRQQWRCYCAKIQLAGGKSAVVFRACTEANMFNPADTYGLSVRKASPQCRNRHSFVGQSPWLLPLLAKVWAE
jgi:hypothetical protein